MNLENYSLSDVPEHSTTNDALREAIFKGLELRKKLLR